MNYTYASTFTHEQLTQFWNAGYTGYFVPITFTEAMLENHLRCGDVQVDKSLVLMDGGNLVGFSFLGVRGDRGWIGGFGIAPAYRGQGHSYTLFAEHVARFPELGLRHVQLEVLTENYAQKVYARAGFETTRRLSILSGQLPEGMPDQGLSLVDPLTLLLYSEGLHATYTAVWQREPAWITKASPLGAQGICMGNPTDPTGFLLYQAAGENLRILDAIGDEETAHALVAQLAYLNPGRTVTIVNEPEDSPVCKALQSAGVKEVRAQFEMHWA